jgi:hypothetical protein
MQTLHEELQPFVSSAALSVHIYEREKYSGQTLCT